MFTTSIKLWSHSPFTRLHSWLQPHLTDKTTSGRLPKDFLVTQDPIPEVILWSLNNLKQDYKLHFLSVLTLAVSVHQNCWYIVITMQYYLVYWFWSSHFWSSGILWSERSGASWDPWAEETHCWVQTCQQNLSSWTHTHKNINDRCKNGNLLFKQGVNVNWSANSVLPSLSWCEIIFAIAHWKFLNAFQKRSFNIWCLWLKKCSAVKQKECLRKKYSESFNWSHFVKLYLLLETQNSQTKTSDRIFLSS